MTRRLSRRRYAEVTRYLKSLIEDEKQPHRMRMRAVDSLMTVYAAHDRAAERAEAKRAAALKGERDATAGDAPDTETEHHAPGETLEEKNAREVEESLAYLRSGGAARNADRP